MNGHARRAARLATRTVALACALAAASAGSASAETSLRAAGTAYVDASAPKARFSSSAGLVVGGSPERRALARWNAPAGTVTTAALRVHAATGSRARLVVRASACSWSAEGVTWRTRPAPGAPLGRLARVRRGWNTVALRTAAIRAGRAVCVQITTGSRTSIHLAGGRGRRGPRLALALRPSGPGPVAAPGAAPARPAATAPGGLPTGPVPRPAPARRVAGPQLYVAPGGSDGAPCTSAAPCRTLAAAQALATPGTTVNVAPGDYAATTLSRPGAAGAPIRYVSTVVWGAHVVAPSPTTGSAITVSARDVVVDGFDVTGGRVGITVTAPDVTVRANHVHEVFRAAPDANGAAGIDVYTGDYGPLAGVVIDGNVVDHVGRTPGASGRVQGIYVAVPCPGGRIVDNVVFAVEDYGIHAYHDPAYWTVANNTVVGNGRGILVGPGFTVVNNISALNRGVAYAVATAATVTGPVAFAANLSFGNGDNAPGAGVRVADPMFVRATTDGTGDYRLAAGSPGVDAGVGTGAPPADFVGVPRPMGAGYDIGAFER